MVALSYKIGLCNVWWDSQSIDTRLFKDIEEQKSYFDNKIQNSLSNLENFNIGDNITTSLIYRNTRELTREEILSYNYAVVIAYERDTMVEYSRRYFFINSIAQDSGNNYRVVLDLDDIQTNYLKVRTSIPSCIIQRCHLDRFDKNSDGTISFKSSPESKLFLREEVSSFSKRPVKREKMDFIIDKSSSSPFNAWIKENILCWVYVYLKPGQYKVKGSNTEEMYTLGWSSVSTLNEGQVGSRLTNPFQVLCYPIYNYSDYIYIRNRTNPTSQYLISDVGFQQFLKDNGGESIILNVKLSFIPPFEQSTYTSESYLIELNQLKILSDDGINSRFGNNLIISQAGFLKLENFDEFESLDISIEDFVKTKFNISELPIKRDKSLNPKLLCSDFLSIKLTNDIDSFEYDPQKLNQEQIQVIYSESFSPDTTRIYARLKTTGEYSQEVYNGINQVNYTGLVSSIDLQIPFALNQLEVFLSNNKNFYQQKQNGYNLQRINYSMNAVGSLGSALVSGNYSGLGGVAQNIASSELGILSDKLNTALTMDNMRSSPETIQNVNGSAIFTATRNKCGVYVEIYKALDQEIKMADDLMYMFGFKYQTLDKIVNHDSTRKLFNYIEADINSLGSSLLSNQESERLKQRLRSIRFWHVDNINYEDENYEVNIYE